MSALRRSRHPLVELVETPGGLRTTEPFGWIGLIENGPRDASVPEAIDNVLAQGFGR